MGNFDTPTSIPVLINIWDINYIKGYTKKDKMHLKKEVLSTKQTDINEMSKVFDKLLVDAKEYTIGESVKIKEYNFDKIDTL